MGLVSYYVVEMKVFMHVAISLVLLMIILVNVESIN